MDGTLCRGDLGLALEALYETFAAYPLDPNMGACPCCVSPAEIKSLAALPLRNARDSDLEHYSHKAISTWGGVDDFKHFLPRLMEIELLEGPLGLLDDGLPRKLVYADFSTWPEPERATIKAALEAWGRAVIVRFPYVGGITMSDCVIWWAHLFGDVSPIVAEWHARLQDTAALQHLAAATYVNFQSLTSEVPPKALQPMLEFLDAPASQEALTAAYLANPGAPWAARLAEASDRLHARMTTP